MFLPDVVYSVAYYLVFTVILVKCYLKLTLRSLKSHKCLVGKTAIVTGGNRGIGLQIVLGLASRGCKVIIACRSKADDAKREIIKRTDNPNILVKHLDLASLNSVRRFCKEIQESEEKIDILINNAGISVDLNKYTEDGLHQTMQVNLFGHFLLTHLLIDSLKKATNARIIFVSSLLSFLHNLNTENLNVQKDGEYSSFFEAFHIYANSKLGMILVANELAERLKPFGITSNSLHPGAIRTDIFENINKLNYISVLGDTFFWLVRMIFFRPLEDGACRCLHIAVSENYENVSGTFLWLLNMPPPIVNNKEFRRNIWERIEDFVKLKEKEKIVRAS